jgi:hypothetical protein
MCYQNPHPKPRPPTEPSTPYGKTLLTDRQSVLAIVAVVLAIKTALVAGLCRAFRLDWQTGVRTGFAPSRVGKFSFVPFTASSAAGLMSARRVTLGYVVASMTMIVTPLMIKLGDRIARLMTRKVVAEPAQPVQQMSNHLVVVGLDEVGLLIALMADKSSVPCVAFDRDCAMVERGQRAGMSAHFADILSDVVQQGVGISRPPGRVPVVERRPPAAGNCHYSGA